MGRAKLQNDFNHLCVVSKKLRRTTAEGIRVKYLTTDLAQNNFCCRSVHVYHGKHGRNVMWVFYRTD